MPCGAAYLRPQGISEQIAAVRALTSRPFQVNLFAGGWTQTSSADAGPMLALLAGLHPRLGLSPPVLPRLGPDPFPDQFEVVLAARPAGELTRLLIEELQAASPALV